MSLGQAQAPLWQVLPPLQTKPQSPPQPSSPQSLPAQEAMQGFPSLAFLRHFLRFFLSLIFLQLLAAASWAADHPSTPIVLARSPASVARREDPVVSDRASMSKRIGSKGVLLGDARSSYRSEASRLPQGRGFRR
jgi:hypothetical protein